MTHSFFGLTASQSSTPSLPTSTADNPPSNSQPSIQFTMETEDEGKLPFLDVMVMKDVATQKFKTKVYRKPTHTDRYLHFDSYHHLMSIIRTLLRRSQRICNSKAASTKETLHIRKAFINNNGYPAAFIDRALRPRPPGQQARPEPVTTVAISYIRGVSVPIRRILAKESIRVSFKTGTSIRSILTKVKPQQPHLDPGKA